MDTKNDHGLADSLFPQEPDIESESDEVSPSEIESIIPHLQCSLEPSVEILNEKPWHRQLAYALLRGATMKECAQMFDKTVAHISQVRRQPWFKKVAAEIADLDRDMDALELLKGSVVTAIETLNDLALGAKSESVRRSAASDLLDKYLKSNPEPQAAEVIDPRAEAKRLEEEIKRLESEEEQRGPNR